PARDRAPRRAWRRRSPSTWVGGAPGWSSRPPPPAVTYTAFAEVRQSSSRNRSRQNPAMARPVIAYADGADSARIGPDAVAALTGLTEPEVLLGWTPDERPWLASPGLRGRTMVAGDGRARAVAAGRLRYLPVRLSAVPRLVEELRPEVAVVTGVRRGVSLAFSQTVGWGPAAVAAATSVVVEV